MPVGSEVAAVALRDRPLAQSLRPVVAHLFFPAVLFGAVAIAIALIESGWSPYQALPATQLPAFLLVALAERLWPHHRSWLGGYGDVPTDLAHTLTIAVTSELVLRLVQLLAVFLAASLAPVVGIGIWPSHWPLWGQLCAALVLVEFFQYWVHRLQHEWEGLWRLHALHHSAPRLYWLNAGRFHPLDIALHSLMGHTPLLALGAGAEVMVLWTLVSAIHGIFQHANVALRLGPLNWVFSMAELHRWHHSKLIAESNHNYGQNLILWDVVFGTRFLPADREPPEDIGIPDLTHFPMTYGPQLLSPFRWKAIRAAG